MLGQDRCGKRQESRNAIGPDLNHLSLVVQLASGKFHSFVRQLIRCSCLR
jgi:hypothetical protein